MRNLTAEELTQAGVFEWSLRMVCGLAKSCCARWGVWLSTSILIFPESEERMLDMTPAAASLAWPGIKLSEGEVAVLPVARRKARALRGRAWGSPVTPAMQLGTEWSPEAGPLHIAEVAAAIGALLNTGCLTETSVAQESTRKKWEKIAKAPADLRKKKADRSWPAAAAPVAKKGN